MVPRARAGVRRPVLMGITKASLRPSRGCRRVLPGDDAGAHRRGHPGPVGALVGLKENGSSASHPAGTGISRYRNIRVDRPRRRGRRLLDGGYDESDYYGGATFGPGSGRRSRWTTTTTAATPATARSCLRRRTTAEGGLRYREPPSRCFGGAAPPVTPPWRPLVDQVTTRVTRVGAPCRRFVVTSLVNVIDGRRRRRRQVIGSARYAPCGRGRGRRPPGPVEAGLEQNRGRVTGTRRTRGRSRPPADPQPARRLSSTTTASRSRRPHPTRCRRRCRA